VQSRQLHLSTSVAGGGDDDEGGARGTGHEARGTEHGAWVWYVHLTQSNHLTATHCAADEILIAIDRRAIQSSLSLWMNEWMPVTAVDRFLIVGCRIHTDVVVLRTRPFSFCFHYVQLQLVNKFDILVRATRLFTSATVADVSAFDTMSTASEVTTYGGTEICILLPAIR